LIKNAEALEKLYKVKVMVFDKTGTLTQGKPEVVEITSKTFSDDELISIAASAENGTEHPLGLTILEYAKRKGLKISTSEEFEAVPGKGVSAKVTGKNVLVGNAELMEENKIVFDEYADVINKLSHQGKTPMLVGIAGKIAGVIAVADTIKDDSRQAIERLHRQNIQVAMLTGDNQNTADYIAKELGIDRVFAKVLPDLKAEIIHTIQQETLGEAVAMVGDGINDAPALAQADVGIAMGTGTDVAIESGDIVLVKGSLSKAVDAIEISKKTMRIIKQNLIWAFGYNVVGIPVAAGLLYPVTGLLLSPIIASIAMALSSVSVVSNSLRLMRA
jgi:Cu+-exporting ATPase